ncbi:MAG: UDP-N-acetylmuramate dehydrogenase [bacterium]|nr:UDP-N-acetylmuramate dehydrogenase [bacterium]
MRKPQEHIPLSRFTTMRVGGPARYFYVAKNVNDIREAIFFAKGKKAPVFVLGGGSNIVVSDSGFDGLVLKPSIKGVYFKENGNTLYATVGAGENWDSFVQKIVLKNIFGIENLSAIPGTVGAAPIQNIGAYGVEVKDFITWVEVFNTQTLEIIKMPREACLFSYRDSVFKRNEGRHLIVTRISFQFLKNQKARIGYKDVSEYIAEHNIQESALSPLLMRNMIIEIRSRKFPDLKKTGTAGSFFKNPIISKEKFLALSHIYRGLPGHDVGAEKTKVPLAWIIENICKRKGFLRDGVGVHDKQALVLVNHGLGTATSIKELAEEIRNDIKKHTGLQTEFEISFVGEF